MVQLLLLMLTCASHLSLSMGKAGRVNAKKGGVDLRPRGALIISSARKAKKMARKPWMKELVLTMARKDISFMITLNRRRYSLTLFLALIVLYLVKQWFSILSICGV